MIFLPLPYYSCSTPFLLEIFLLCILCTQLDDEVVVWVVPMMTFPVTCISSGAQAVYLPSQCCFQWCHIGSLTSAMMEILTPQKLANITNQGALPANTESWWFNIYQHTTGYECNRPNTLVVSFRCTFLLWSIMDWSNIRHLERNSVAIFLRSYRVLHFASSPYNKGLTWGKAPVPQDAGLRQAPPDSQYGVPTTPLTNQNNYLCVELFPASRKDFIKSFTLSC